MPTHNDFALAQLRFSVFTPGLQFQTKRVLSRLPSAWQTVFDGDPVSLPDLPQSPVQVAGVPRLVLRSADGTRELQIAPERVDLVRIDRAAGGLLDPQADMEQAVSVLTEYLGIVHAEAGRLACIATRTTRDATPARTLAQHFCKEVWIEGALNRPADFEIHAHKRFRLLDGLEVNSWIRCKTAILVPQEVTGAREQPVILVEQDLNTLQEDADTRDFTSSDLRTFFFAALPELQAVLSLYFPG